jgi:hypothetical protein
VLFVSEYAGQFGAGRVGDRTDQVVVSQHAGGGFGGLPRQYAYYSTVSTDPAGSPAIVQNRDVRVRGRPQQLDLVQGVRRQ